MIIEKNIPLPSWRSEIQKFPWPEMEVGNSIEVGAEDASRAKMSAGRYKIRHPGWEWESHKTDRGTIRIWRTA